MNMKTAFVFPGQGSQSVGMLRDYADHPVVRATLEEASAALGQDLLALTEAGPEADLNQTANTQPVMLAADVAIYRAWRAAGGGEPAVLAGHSLGEYAALVVAEVIDFTAAVRVVRARGEAMQAAVPAGQGGIAAILGLDVPEVEAACAEAGQGQVVSPANLNAPGQIVISGARAAVERAIEACKARGAKRAVMLPMSVPAHCSLMRPAAEVLAHALGSCELRPARIPVVNNVDVALVDRPADIQDALVRQLYSPVRWIETVQALELREGAGRIVECGPGKVLHGLVRRIVTGATAVTLSSGQVITDTIAAIAQGETA
jgi:[acyl-carrier-protein] S-malonyltransferase